MDLTVTLEMYVSISSSCYDAASLPYGILTRMGLLFPLDSSKHPGKQTPRLFLLKVHDSRKLKTENDIKV